MTLSKDVLAHHPIFTRSYCLQGETGSDYLGNGHAFGQDRPGTSSDLYLLFLT